MTAICLDYGSARRILQHCANDRLLERDCFEVTICSTHSTWAGSVFTGSLSWQALSVPSEEFLSEE